MFIIDDTNFTREYHVPNKGSSQTDAGLKLNQYIDSDARLCVKDALGVVLYNDLLDNMTNGVLDAGADQIWKDLVNGKEYALNGITYNWQGLSYNEGIFKSSLLTPFVYYKWLKDNSSLVAGVGEIVGNAKNATNVNSSQRLVNTWNTFVSLYQGNCISTPKRYIYNGVLVTDWFMSDSDSGYVSLIKFLSDNSDDYPDAAMKLYNFKNQLGL